MYYQTTLRANNAQSNEILFIEEKFVITEIINIKILSIM